ncbi:uncharacterized protein LOC121731529 [Aricia agestis]|uniref:uncharacterized protein LOC121731529 n=1 Tax=Aricia agestis TaxID=91739 RepID=UPI001C2026B3|nr:uncharacterized protein LOC121731529 [Aricia agestis]
MSDSSKTKNKTLIRKSLKERGKSYVSRKGKVMPPKKPPSMLKICKCKNQCDTIDHDMKLTLFDKFYREGLKTQRTYLMGLLHLHNIKRRRHGNYDVPSESRRQATIFYFIPKGDGTLVPVCKKTFMDVFAISKKEIETMIRKKKHGDTSFTDKRTSHQTSKYTELDVLRIKDHINMFPRDESHYTRAKSSKEYLSPDLNIHRCFKSFNEMHPDNQVSYKFYRKIFLRDFPNLKFKRPRTDTCKVCDRLSATVRSQNSGSRSAKIALELHHRKAEKSREQMGIDRQQSQLPGSTTVTLAIDLQQVLFVPTLTHSEMFYKRQLSCYNLCINVADIGNSFMCLWHEGICSRGGNEIASCLLTFINKRIITKKDHLIIWCDNCAGQNKNRMMLFLLMYLVANGHFKSIEQKFLITGHSFLQCDRDFGIIEKRKKVMKSYVPQDLKKVISGAKNTAKPFQVIDMTSDCFFDLQAAADDIIVTKKLNISTASRLLVREDKPGVVHVKENLGDLEPWKEINVLKRGKSISDLKNVELRRLVAKNTISREKKKDLESMIEYLPENYQEFYRNLCNN